VEKSLVAKAESLGKDMHTTILIGALLFKLQNGGEARIRERFGNAASFHHMPIPKMIVIYGSRDDAQIARSLIMGPALTGPRQPQADDCAICWCPAEEPLKTACGHIYCKECFLHAASSSANQLPLHCDGDGACSHIFTIVELQKILPFSNFEKLLQGI
jgi:hypothetical protein